MLWLLLLCPRGLWSLRCDDAGTVHDQDEGSTESPASAVPPAEELVSDQALIDGIEGADSEIAAAEEEEEVVEEEVVKEEVVEEKVVEEKTPGSAPAAISEPEAGA